MGPAAAGLLAVALGLGLLGGLCVVLESIDDAIVGGVSGEVLEPKTSRALASEHIGDPAKGVIKVPNGDSDAALDLGTSTDNLKPMSAFHMGTVEVGRVALTFAYATIC